MLKRIVMQVSGIGMDQCTRLWAWLTTRLWNPVSNWLVSFTHKYLNVDCLLNQYARMVLSFRVLLVNLITQVQSIKLVLSTAKHKLIQIGLQLQKTVRQILLLVNQLFKKGK